MTKHLKITVEGKVYDVVVEDVTEDAGSSLYPQPGLAVSSAPVAATAAPVAAPAATTGAPAGAKDKVSPLGGVIVEISVKVGDKVSAGQQVAVLEAMKMKTVVAADYDGTVTNIAVKVGEAVDSGQTLMTIE